MLNAAVKPVIHPAQDFVNGMMVYGLRIGKEARWITSARELFDRKRLAATVAKVTAMPAFSRFSPQGARDFLQGATVDPVAVFQEIWSFLTRHIAFRHRWQATLIAIWVLGTYVHRVFPWFGYVWINSPTMRSGKTLLEEVIASLAFNATPVLTCPTEAFLFRDPAVNASSLILDEVESLTDADQEMRSSLMAVLNVGFKRGSVIPRVEAHGKRYRIEYFEAFSPKVLAGIKSLAATVRDRCLKIELWRKRRGEHLERFDLRKLELALQALRDKLHIFGLTYAKDVADFYSKADDLPLPEGLDDRARDILEPLFAIAGVIDATAGNKRVTTALTDAAMAIGGLRAGEEAGDEAVLAAIPTLQSLFEGDNANKKVLRGAEALALFQGAGIDWMEKEGQAKWLLRQLGFRSSTHKVEGSVVRGYGIRREVIEELAERYLSEDRKEEGE